MALNNRHSDTETLTLPAFLLAAIADDEAVAREVEAAAREDFARSPADYGGKDPTQNRRVWQADGNGGDPVFVMGVARVLAQCEAHRRIVELHASDGGHECPAGHDGSGDVYVDYEQNCPTLRAIASVYADRPGWQESWR